MLNNIFTIQQRLITLTFISNSNIVNSICSRQVLSKWMLLTFKNSCNKNIFKSHILSHNFTLQQRRINNIEWNLTVILLTLYEYSRKINTVSLSESKVMAVKIPTSLMTIRQVVSTRSNQTKENNNNNESAHFSFDIGLHMSQNIHMYQLKGINLCMWTNICTSSGF